MDGFAQRHVVELGRHQLLTKARAISTDYSARRKEITQAGRGSTRVDGHTRSRTCTHTGARRKSRFACIRSKVEFYSDNWAVFGWSYTEGLQYFIAKRESLGGQKWAAVSFRGMPCTPASPRAHAYGVRLFQCDFTACMQRCLSAMCLLGYLGRGT